jgi:death on curing protein
MTEEKRSQTNYLDETALKEVAHEMACRLFQEKEPMGLFDDHDPAKLDSCINLPKQSVFGQEMYPGVYRKAAITFYAFNRNHAFRNGNKRMSVAALVVFLFINDKALTVSTKEMREKALWLAQVEARIEDVVDELTTWVQKNTISVQELMAVTNT